MTTTTTTAPRPAPVPAPAYDLDALFASITAGLTPYVDPDTLAIVERAFAAASRPSASTPAADGTAAPRVGTGTARTFTMYGINEAAPGPRWKALFDATWPAYRAWYLQEGDAARPDLATAEARLRRHMPELVPTWEAMVALSGDDETAARFLTMWDLPAFLPGCSQAVLTGDHPVLVRNYDYAPDLFEWVSYSSAFTGRKVIGTSDCLWGLLDGMNDRGFAVSLTYGGAAGSGPGFAIPIVVRYLLEVAGTVQEAQAALAGLPVSMSYNLTLTDATGAVVTAYVAPGREPEYFDTAVATNHRGRTPERPEHARAFASVERQDCLLDLLATDPEPATLVDAFAERPLHNDAFSRGFGTVYTAAYEPAEQRLTYAWPGSTFTRTFDSPDATAEVTLVEG